MVRVPDNLFRRVANGYVSPNLQTGELTYQELVQHLGKPLCLGRPYVRLRRKYFDVQQYDFRIEMTRVRSYVPSGELALRGEVYGKENAFEACHIEPPFA
jgi:hypothetical protein